MEFRKYRDPITGGWLIGNPFHREILFSFEKRKKKKVVKNKKSKNK